MKLNKRILAFVLTLAMAFNMAIPALAAPASSEAAEAAPGEQATLEFVYENVVSGFEGHITFSNPAMVKSIDKIEVYVGDKLSDDVTFNLQTGRFIFADLSGITVIPTLTVKVTITLSEGAVVGENLTVNMDYTYTNNPDAPQDGQIEDTDSSDVVIIPDYTKLEEAIAEAETYLPNKDEYEVGKWAAFETALAEAKEALNATTQGEVETATANLRAAMNALTAPDLSALLEQIVDAGTKIEKQYTKASWQNLQTVLAEAETVYNTSKDQNEIDQMTETLKAAIAALVAAPDRTLLLEQIARAEALNKLDYTTETWEGRDVDGKLATAKGLTESDDADAINLAANALKVALDALKAPVTTGLETQLSAAVGITDIGYTASSWDKFVEKYAAAQKVYDDVIAKTERSQTAIDTAANALENAIAELDTLEREALEDKIFIAKVRLNGLYTVASKDALRPVLEDAEDVYANARTQEAIDAAVEALDAAIKALVALPNYEELEKQIEAAEDLINAGKEMENTIQSWAEMMDAYNNAVDVLARLEEDASVVNSAATALRDAITMLSAPDYSAITNLLAEIAGLTETDYTPSTWQALMQEVAEANEVIANVDNGTLRDQDAINAAADELDAAIKALVALPNYEELEKQIEAAEALINAGKEMENTIQSWAEMMDAYNNAKDVLQRLEEDASVVNSAAQKLENAINALVLMNYDELNSQIGAADAIMPGEIDYTEDSWNEFKTAYDAAVAAKTSRDQLTVDNAAIALKDAIATLVKIDREALNNAINSVPTDEDTYTTESWADLQNALNAAIAAKTSREQQVVDDATEALINAIGALKKPDYDALQGVIDSILAEEKYSEVSWNTFAPTFEEAKSLINNKERSQTAIDNMVTTLKNAAEGLELMNYDNLKDALENAPTNETPYTTESWKDFTDAKEAAENAMSSRDQGVVNKALEDLNDAIGALVAPDYKNLNNAINDAIALPEFDYTKSSYDVFELYIEEMKALVGTERTQAKIEAAAQAILDAIANDLVKMDYSGFNAADADYNSRTEITYTTESWKALVEAYDAAVAAKEAREQDGLDKAVEELNKALAALAEPDYSELQSAIDSILAEEKYSEKSWNTFAPTFEAAKALIANNERSQTTINDMVTTLTEAAKLLEVMDYSKLEAAINDANALDETKYTTETWGDLQKVLAEIETNKILESRDQGVVDSALSVLNQKVASLKAPDYTSLKDAIDAANALTETDYTKASYDALMALVAEKAALVDVERTQANIEAAAQAILDAIANDLVKMDYSGFNAAETDYKSRDELTYTTESWADVVEAYAKAVEAKEAREQTALDTAVDALNAALAALAKPDYSALQGVIDSILAEEKYSEASWNTFVPTLEAAKALIANNERTQATINAMVTTLTEAAKLLEVMDYSKLREAIDKANSLDENKYTTETWDVLKAALADAEATLTSRVPADVEAAAKTLNDAIDALAEPDYTSLKDAIDAANALTETDYTKVSYDALMALVAEKAAFVDVERTQAKIEAYAKEITDAIANDLVKMDYSGFEAAEDAYEALNKDDYTSASWDAIVEAYEKAVAAKEAREQTALNAAVDALNAAIDARVPAGLAELLEMIEEAKKFDGKDADYTTDSWTLFADAKAAAEALVDSKNNAEIVNATAKLNEKMSALVPVGREALEQAIKSAIELEKQIDVWTTESIAALAAARANGEAVVNGLDNNAIVAATNAINEAIDKLDPLTDAAELIKQITIAKALDKNLYTEKSWNAFLEVLANAEYVRDNYKTQDEIDAAKNALIDAMNSLVKMDYTELNIQIGKAPATTDELLYSEETWNKMIEALAAANAAKTSRDQTVVDAATKALKDAIAALTEMNYTELLEQIEAAGKLNKDLYTESTWAKVESALAAANAAKTSRDQTVVDAATKALKDAIAALVLMDYNDLAEIIERAQALTESKYTDKSWKVLEEALEAAIAAQSSHDQSVVNAAANALAEAIESLVPMNLDALIEQIEAAEKLIASEYTSASWADLEIALEAANEALTSTNQLTVNEAAEALAEAIADLVKMDYSKLTQVIESIGALNKELYTAESWAALEAALAEAEKAYEYRVQADVDAAVKALEDAIAALEFVEVPDVDTSALAELIARAEALDGEKYTAETWAALQSALANAKTALKSDSQQVIDDAAKALSDAIAALKEKEIEPPQPTVDYTELNKAIEAAGKLNKDDWTDATWAELTAKLEAAKAALASTEQSVVDAAAKALNDAISALEKKPVDPPTPTVDYTELLEQIEAAEKLNKDEWTDATWAELTAKLEAAKAALTSTEQSVVDAAAKALKDAIAALETKPAEPTVDYTELLEQIARTEGLKEADYTAATWKAMSDALASANAALNSKDQSVVDAATEALKNAIDALEKAPVEPDPQPQPDPEPEFPWVVVIIIIIVAALAGAAVVVVIILKKKGIIKL